MADVSQIVRREMDALKDELMTLAAQQMRKACFETARAIQGSTFASVETWLKAQRDAWGMDTDRPEWVALDNALDDFRLHMQTGTPLTEHACEGSHCCDQ